MIRSEYFLLEENKTNNSENPEENKVTDREFAVSEAINHIKNIIL